MKPYYKYVPPVFGLLFLHSLLFSFPLVWVMFNQGFVCNSNVLFELLFGAYCSRLIINSLENCACMRVCVYGDVWLH